MPLLVNNKAFVEARSGILPKADGAPSGCLGWVSLLFSLCPRIKFNFSCNVLKTSSPFLRRMSRLFGLSPSASVLGLVCFLLSSSSARADLTQQEVEDAVYSGVYSALLAAPISFNQGAINAVPWLFPSFEGLTIGEYLVNAFGYPPILGSSYNLRSDLQDIVSRLQDLSSNDLHQVVSALQRLSGLTNSVEELVAYSSTISGYQSQIAHDIYNMYGFVDDIAFDLYHFYDLFDSTFYTLNNQSSPAVSVHDADLISEIHDLASDFQSGFSDLGSSFSSGWADSADLITNALAQLSFDLDLSDIENYLYSIEFDLYFLREDLTDPTRFESQANNAEDEGRYLADQAQSDAESSFSDASSSLSLETSDSKYPSFDNSIVPNPWDPLLDLPQDAVDAVSDRIPTSSDFSFSPEMTLIYSNHDEFHDVSEIKLNFRTLDFVPSGSRQIMTDWSSKATRLMAWFWKLVVDVSTIAIVFRSIRRIHDNIT